LKILLEKSTNLNQPFEGFKYFFFYILPLLNLETIYKTEKTVIFIHGRRECDRLIYLEIIFKKLFLSLSIVLACEGFRVIPVNT